MRALRRLTVRSAGPADDPQTAAVLWGMAAAACSAGLGAELSALCAGSASSDQRDRLEHDIQISAWLGKHRLNWDAWQWSAAAAFVDQYRSSPYHAVYVADPRQRRGRGELRFLAEFFRPLDQVTADALTVYFDPDQLAEAGHARGRPDWDWTQVPPLRHALAKIDEPVDALVIWPREHVKMVAEPIGRLDRYTRLGWVAAFVAAINAGTSFGAARKLAWKAPRAVDRLPPGVAVPDQFPNERAWIIDCVRDLKAAAQRHPNAGYDRAAAKLELILSPRPVARRYAYALVHAVLALGQVLQLEHSAVVDAPHDIQHLYEVLTGEHQRPAGQRPAGQRPAHEDPASPVTPSGGPSARP